MGGADLGDRADSQGVAGRAVMTMFRRVVGGVRALFRNEHVERELDAELREYLDAAVDQKMSAGMSRTDAERAARVEMGSLEAVKDHVRDVGWESRIETLLQDLRYAVRMAAPRARPGRGRRRHDRHRCRRRDEHVQHHAEPSAGAAAARDRTGSRLPAAPGVRADDGSDSVFAATSYPFYELLASRPTSLETVAAYTSTDLAVGTGPDARMAARRDGVGRFLANPGASSGAGPLHPGSRGASGHGLARRRARTCILAASLRRQRRRRGQHARGSRDSRTRSSESLRAPFGGLSLPTSICGFRCSPRPTGVAAAGWHTARTSYNLTLVGRLKREVTTAQASAELSTLYSAFLLEAYGPGSTTIPQKTPPSVKGIVAPAPVLGPVMGGLGTDLRRIPEARVTAWLVGIAFVLLAVACSNVAGLLLLRADRAAPRDRDAGSRSAPAAGGSHVSC